MTSEQPDRKSGRSIGQILLLSAGFFVLVAISTLSVFLVNQSHEDNAWLVHTVEVDNQVNTVLLNIRRAESATRAYMLSQAPQFLAEKESAASVILPEIDHLAELTADNPIQSENTAKLRQAAVARLADFDRGIDRVKNNDVAASIETLRQERSTDAAEGLTKIAEAMHAEEYRLFLERTRTTDRTQMLASVVTVVGSALVIALAAISIFLVRRSLRARDVAEARLRDANLNLEATVDERTADLREANQEIQRFAYIVSHDLRSPLVNIMGFTSELDELRTDIFKRIATLAGAPVPAAAGDGGEIEPVLEEKDKQLAEDFRDRPERFRSRVDQAGVHTVASGKEAVLGEHLLERGGTPRHVSLLQLQPSDGLNECDQCRRLRDTGLRVHDPDLDGSEAGLGTNVPPQEGRLGERPDAQLKIDRLDPLGVGPVASRHARPREGLEKDCPSRGESRVATPPEGRVARESEQKGEVDTEPVVEVDRALWVGHADVNMQRERRFTRRQVPHRLPYQTVAAG